jgi:hypothetical protein
MHHATFAVRTGEKAGEFGRSEALRLWQGQQARLPELGARWVSQNGVTRYAETDTFAGPSRRCDTIWVGPSGQSDGPDGQYETRDRGNADSEKPPKSPGKIIMAQPSPPLALSTAN